MHAWMSPRAPDYFTGPSVMAAKNPEYVPLDSCVTGDSETGTFRDLANMIFETGLYCANRRWWVTGECYKQMQANGVSATELNKLQTKLTGGFVPTSDMERFDESQLSPMSCTTHGRNKPPTFC
eukprot:GDKI01039842.1.p1 GENE.GDKI01039842.1~~GDKI01039842.1.p1  ORF type:complete len:124 (+),score=27.63 GDKI01039842.1:238-609(+)